MDKKNLIKGGLICAAVGLGVYFLYKQFKKEEKKLIDEKNAADQELESIGVPTKKLNEEVDAVEDENNMVKALAIGTMFNPNWDFDFVDPERALGANNVLSVTQEVFRNDRGNEMTDLVLYFDIPHYKDGKMSRVIGDYIVALKDSAEHAESIVKFCPRPKKRLIGLLAVTYDDPKDPEDRISERVEIDPSVYEELSDGTHDGLVAFYEGITGKTLPDSVNTKLMEWVNQKWPKPLGNFEINEVQLAYRVAFKMQDQGGIGINYVSALEVLKWYVEEFEVKLKGGKKMKYENIFFCAPSVYTGKHELTWYYYVNDDNKMDINNFSY